jgi:hypothetical protein
VLIVDESASRKNFIDYTYAYFDFRLNVREPGFIHPRCNRIVVVRLILDLHDVLTARREKENNENTISGRTDSLRRMISLGLQQVPVAAPHSLSPTAICRIRKNSAFPPPRILRRYGTKHYYTTSDEQSSRNSPFSATRSPRSAVMDAGIERKPRERNEAKRGRDPTGAAGPRMPCGPAGSGTLVEWGG